VFSQVDQYRTLSGRPSLKNNAKATKDLDIAFNFMKRTTRQALKQSTIKPAKLNIIQTFNNNLQSVSQKNSTHASTRETVHVNIDKNYSDDDPQGYIKMFEHHILDKKSLNQ
jgi:hypothetical protein